MLIERIAVPVIIAAVVAASPVAPVQAQYYYPVCTPNPLSWPFCVAGAAVGTAAAIVSAPFVAATGRPYYYYGQPYYGASPYRRSYAVGDGHEPWNRPSPSDHVARQLNRQELARTY